MYVSKKREHIGHMVLMILALLLFTGTMWAQNIKITGRVIDKTNQPMIGVSVVVDGTRTGVATDMDGNYSISAQGNATITFSAIGMKSQKVAVNNRTLINVTLDVDALLLDELVVVGYGVQRKENLTGAVASIDTKLLEARPITDVGRGFKALRRV